jgi:hypothetical protein
MHRFNVILAVAAGWLLLNAVAPAQETNGCCVPAPRTRMEALEAKTGAVIVKGTMQMGAVPGKTGSVTVRCKEYTDLGTGLRDYGVAVEVKVSEQLEDTSFIDYDELDALLKGMEYISKVDFTVSSLTSFDASFTTKGGLRVAAHGSRRTGFIEASVQSQGSRFSRAGVSISMTELAQFRVLMEQAKVKLDAIRAGK